MTEAIASYVAELKFPGLGHVLFVVRFLYNNKINISVPLTSLQTSNSNGAYTSSTNLNHNVNLTDPITHQNIPVKFESVPSLPTIEYVLFYFLIFILF